MLRGDSRRFATLARSGPSARLAAKMPLRMGADTDKVIECTLSDMVAKFLAVFKSCRQSRSDQWEFAPPLRHAIHYLHKHDVEIWHQVLQHCKEKGVNPCSACHDMVAAARLLL